MSALILLFQASAACVNAYMYGAYHEPISLAAVTFCLTIMFFTARRHLDA